jgi:CRP-like cAMP-binding protein
MALDVVVQSLLRVELFVGLKPRQVAELARRSDRLLYRPGQPLITEGQAGDAAVLIIAGDAVRIEGPGLANSEVEMIPEGSLVGELAMLVETVHTSTIIARGPIRAIRITREAVHAQIAEDPEMALQLSTNLARRLHGVADQLRRIDALLADIEQSTEADGLPPALPQFGPPALPTEAHRLH